jgi:hypothetical protein
MNTSETKYSDRDTLNGMDAEVDLSLKKHADGDWRLSALSDRGKIWLRLSVLGKGPMNLKQANAVLLDVRSTGLKTKYHGPRGEVII